MQQLENLVDAQSQTIKKQQRELQNLQEENQLLQKRNQELYKDSFQQESREKERQSPKERSISKFTVTERAYLLGHSVDTNQRHYSFVREESLESARNRLNAIPIHSQSLKNVVSFSKEKSLVNSLFTREIS